MLRLTVCTDVKFFPIPRGSALLTTTGIELTRYACAREGLGLNLDWNTYCHEVPGASLSP